MLSAADLALRPYFLGSSDIPAILGESTYLSPIDVWMRKARAGEEPRVKETSLSTHDQEEGAIFEGAIAELYMRRNRGTSLDAAPVRRLPKKRFQSTPDFFLHVGDHDTRILEVKHVKIGAGAQWSADALPVHVELQVQWQLLLEALIGSPVSTAVVAAYLAGKGLAAYQVSFDQELAELLVEAANTFWAYVDEGEPPPLGAKESHEEYVRKRYPRAARELDFIPCDPDHPITLAVFDFIVARNQHANAAAVLSETRARLMEQLGEAPGATGPWGKFSWQERRGQVSYKGALMDLAGGTLDTDLLERHRGRLTRTLDTRNIAGAAAPEGGNESE